MSFIASAYAPSCRRWRRTSRSRGRVELALFGVRLDGLVEHLHRLGELAGLHQDLPLWNISSAARICATSILSPPLPPASSSAM